ncbi:MAG: hypothetical protein R2710_04195 [Acidimicrobiales bacterium]
MGKRPLFSLSDAFIERCDANDVDHTASIITNGYLLDADMCRELAARRVRSAQIGLDGPPDVHDRYRPLASGGATFGRIVENLHHAADHFDVALRVNLDRSNAPRAVELLDILEQEGLRGRVSVYVANLVGSTVDGIGPNADYATPLMSKREFAQVELEFKRELVVRGFARPHLVSPKGTACTAVRRNSMVIGSGRAVQVLGLCRRSRRSDRPHRRSREHQLQDPALARLRPLRRRRVPGVHRPSGVHGRVRPPCLRRGASPRPVRHLPRPIASRCSI